MSRNGPQNSCRILWFLFSYACAQAACQSFPGAKPASTSHRTSNYPGHPIFPIHQSYGRVAYVNAISNAIPPADTKKPVKRQLNLDVSLKNKKNVFFCNASFPVYNNHFLIRTFSIMTKRLIKQEIQRKTRPRSFHRLYQLARNFVQQPRRLYQLHREV